MGKIGFNADRTITMEREFFRPPDVAVRCSLAKIEMFGHVYQVEVEIDEHDDLGLPGVEIHGKDADPQRQNARQLMELYELAQRSTRDFEKCSGVLPEVDVSIPSPPGGRPNWTTEEVRDYVSQRLAVYHIQEWEPGFWQAKPRA